MLQSYAELQGTAPKREEEVKGSLAAKPRCSSYRDTVFHSKAQASTNLAMELLDSGLISVGSSQ